MKSSDSKCLCFYSSTMKAKVPPPLPPKVRRFVFHCESCLCVLLFCHFNTVLVLTL